MSRGDVEQPGMANEGRPRRMRARRHHLELVSSEEWPDDVFPLLQMARDGFLEREAPDPAPEVLAFLEQPAHGKVDSDGLMVRHGEPEPIELTGGATVRRAPRRALVAAGGTAAALALVALGLRPTFTASRAIVRTAPSTVPATPVAGVPTTAAASTSAPEHPTPTVDATSLEPDPVMVIVSDGTSTDPVAPVETTAAPTTAKPPAPTTAKPRPRSTTGKATTPPTTPASATSRAAVLAYYDASNNRGRCVAHQPAKSTRAELTGACGPEPVPPQNLYLYWAARDQWNECAQPFYERGWGEARVATACGHKPDRAQFDVPPNPYSRSQN